VGFCISSLCFHRLSKPYDLSIMRLFFTRVSCFICVVYWWALWVDAFRVLRVTTLWGWLFNPLPPISDFGWALPTHALFPTASINALFGVKETDASSSDQCTPSENC